MPDFSCPDCPAPFPGIPHMLYHGCARRVRESAEKWVNIMMIDASLGRAGCGCPQNLPVPQPVPPFVPDAGVSALNIQLATAQASVAPGAVLPIGASVRQYGDALSYDAANHAVAVNAPGLYAFDWQVLTQSAGEETDAVISLQSLDGTAVLASSGALAVPTEGGTLISGSAVARLQPGTSWALVNNSGAAIALPAAGTAPAAFTASMTVTSLSARPFRA